MPLFNRFSIGVKLVGGFALVTLFLATVAGVGYFYLKLVNQRVAEVSAQTASMQDIGEAQASLEQIRGDVYQYFLIPAPQATLTATQTAGNVPAPAGAPGCGVALGPIEGFGKELHDARVGSERSKSLEVGTPPTSKRQAGSGSFRGP